MGRVYEAVDATLAEFIERQPLFFVSTAPLAADGLVNCSPKGNRDELKVVDPTHVAYLDQTGSGVETIAHLRENGRIVIMVCAFTGPPRIVRLHGHGRVCPVDDPEFAALATLFPGSGATGVRAIVVVDVARVADSCGYAVPVMDFAGHRTTLDEWADRRGEDGIRAYWAEKNTASLDGLAALDVTPS